jgi:CRP/FNR family transcriptional regulator, anaerobic regulatory protein
MPAPGFLAAFPDLFPESEWPARERESLLDSLAEREVPAGTVIARDGDTCQSLPFVLSGGLRVYRRGESGREITLYRVLAGQTCVLSAACADPFRAKSFAFPVTAEAEEDTRAVFMPLASLKRAFELGQSFRAYVFSQLYSRMSEVIELVDEVAFRHVDERLALFLREQAAPDGSLRSTHQELADHLGTSREVVSRILKDWESRGGLELGRGEISLLRDFDRVAAPPL